MPSFVCNYQQETPLAWRPAALCLSNWILRESQASSAWPSRQSQQQYISNFQLRKSSNGFHYLLRVSLCFRSDTTWLGKQPGPCLYHSTAEFSLLIGGFIFGYRSSNGSAAANSRFTWICFIVSIVTAPSPGSVAHQQIKKTHVIVDMVFSFFL